MKKLMLLKKRFSRKEITLEQLLDLLADDGYCPNLMNDDNGHWALVFDGFQNVPLGNDPDDISSCVWIERKYWKDNIRGAVLFRLTEMILDYE